MQSEDFAHVVERQQTACAEVLIKKGQEYALDKDQLHNFKIAAQMQGVTVRQALAGMMAKHTVSIYDMCRSEEIFSKEQWTEKITDHLNYLILLKAIVVEEEQSVNEMLDFSDIDLYMNRS